MGIDFFVSVSLFNRLIFTLLSTLLVCLDKIGIENDENKKRKTQLAGVGDNIIIRVVKVKLEIQP